MFHVAVALKSAGIKVNKSDIEKIADANPELSKIAEIKAKEEEAKAKAKEQGITGPSGGQASGAIEGVAVTAPVYNYSQENKSTPLGAPGKKKSPAYKMKGSMFQKRY